jgi:hypothetical protein
MHRDFRRLVRILVHSAILSSSRPKMRPALAVWRPARPSIAAAWQAAPRGVESLIGSRVQYACESVTTLRRATAR